MRIAWRLVAGALAPVLPLWLRLRAGRGKEDASRLAERYGRGADRPAAPLLWLHGASVGEALSLLPLIEAVAIAAPEAQFLITTGTVTSARLVMQRLPAMLRDRVRHRYAPLDVPRWVDRFLNGWRPDAAVFVDSDLWPNRLFALRARRIPTALVNARMSPRSAQRWAQFAPGLLRAMLRSFTLIQPRAGDDAARFAGLGARNMLPPADLKASANPLPHDPEALAALRAGLPGPVFLAASTHPGEDALVAEAHGILRERHPTLTTIIVPRHPERGAEIAALTGAPRRSLGQAPAGLYIADTLGELGLFYRLANVALVGGSLVAHGGQNPMEPARLGCPILLGPYTFNFAERVEQLLEARAALRVSPPDAPTLAAAVADVLINPDEAARMTDSARSVAENLAGAAERLAGPLVEWLRAGHGPSAASVEREFGTP
jgi:3-deoxy-D-manno-octulosonic-acid transferase